MKRNIGSTRVAMAALLVAVGATTLSAQSTAQVPTDEIAALETKAQGYLKDYTNWNRAASLFRRTAELRPADDPAAVEDLIRAARLSFYKGDERRAMYDFEAAGQRALAIGDVLAAANAFTDAAWVAEARGRDGQAHELLSKAQLLSNSPLIPEDARLDLRSRWDVTGLQP